MKKLLLTLAIVCLVVPISALLAGCDAKEIRTELEIYNGTPATLVGAWMTPTGDSLMVLHYNGTFTYGRITEQGLYDTGRWQATEDTICLMMDNGEAYASKYVFEDGRIGIIPITTNMATEYTFLVKV
jgi:hypothetical protein